MFFLYFNRNNKKSVEIDSEKVIKDLYPFITPDKSGHFKKDHLLLVQCVNWNTAASTLEPAPFIYSAAKISIASWARIDNRGELGDKLGITVTEMAQTCDSELIVRSYLKWDAVCADHLIGDFVFALYDENKQKVFCARDHMGVRPFYYYLSDDIFICATSLSALLPIKGLSIKIRTQWIVEYLTGLSMSFDMTPYEDVYKLPPAHILTVTKSDHTLRQYFKLSAEPELRLKDSREYVDAYREQLETSIKCRLDTTYPLGSELSGGLDSSTITAYGAKFFHQPLTNFHTFAFVTSKLEPEYIMAVSQAYGLPRNHIIAGRQHGREAVIDRSLKILGYPVEHGNATYHEPFYQLAEKFNIRTLLSGFGGDEFGTTIHGYMVPLELMMKGQYKNLYRILPGNPFFRFLRLAKLGFQKIKTRNFTRPEYNPKFFEAFRQRWPHQIIRQEFVKKFNLMQRYFDQARFDAGYTDLKKFTIDNRWAPFVPTRMENCALMAAARKVEYRWPLLDLRLIKVFLTIPSKENYFRGMGRYLHRRAIEGVVPDIVTWKQSKNMGNPFSLNKFAIDRQDGFLITELSSIIEKMIDMEKYAKQLGTMPQHASGTDYNNMSLIYMQNMQRLRNLNSWLSVND